MTVKTYSAHIAPMRHDDPRRATRASRAAAAKAAADALAAAGLRPEYRSSDPAKIEAIAARMRQALKPVGRDARASEVTAIPLRF